MNDKDKKPLVLQTLSHQNNFLTEKMIRAFRYTITSHHPHKHDFFECVYIEDGQGFHIINGQRFYIKSGDCFIIDPQATHDYQFIDDKPITVINIIFVPEFIDKSLCHCQCFRILLSHYLLKLNISSITFNSSFYVFDDKNGQIHKLFIQILNEFNNKKNAYQELIRCYLIEFLLLSFRTIDVLPTAQLSIEVYEILMYIMDNYSKDITLSEICKSKNYSVSYISKKIKEETGYNFIYHLQNTRINFACHMLVNTNEKISNIASVTGYTDEKYFRDVFKKCTGLSPSSYKRLHK